MGKIRSRRRLLLRRYTSARICRMYKLLRYFQIAVLCLGCLGLGIVASASAKTAEKTMTAEQYAESMKAYWDKTFSKKGYFIGTEPDEFFADELSKLRPGRLLLPGEGEGRNAVFAASRGWKVDAFDFSTKARDKAIALAKKQGVYFRYLLADFGNPDLPEDTFDVVAIIDLPTMPNIRHNGFASVRKSLKPGGTIIYEGYAPRPGEVFWASRDELKKEFSGFRYKVLTTRNVIRFHEGKDHIDLVVQMVAVK
jgi:SAM-dependent methyltransferase